MRYNGFVRSENGLLATRAKLKGESKTGPNISQYTVTKLKVNPLMLNSSLTLRVITLTPDVIEHL